MRCKVFELFRNAKCIFFQIHVRELYLYLDFVRPLVTMIKITATVKYSDKHLVLNMINSKKIVNKLDVVNTIKFRL